NLSRRTTMAAKRPARASLRYAKAPLSPRYQRELHQLLGHCLKRATEHGYCVEIEIPMPAG
ncbi:MAG: hypothetical protein ABJD57_03440, partial [Roseibium sp.]|uniref:hypothetical protein n=1 Tax=Roseibium sp. TaxID=1936156 RepID=UPI003267DBD0